MDTPYYILINYTEMFSLLGVLNMEGRVWFEGNLTRISVPHINYYACKIHFAHVSGDTRIDKWNVIRRCARARSDCLIKKYLIRASSV